MVRNLCVEKAASPCHRDNEPYLHHRVQGSPSRRHVFKLLLYARVLSYDWLSFILKGLLLTSLTNKHKKMNFSASGCPGITRFLFFSQHQLTMLLSFNIKILPLLFL